MNEIIQTLSMRKTLLIVTLIVMWFPNFLSGLYHFKKDVTFLYCSVSKSCND